MSSTKTGEVALKASVMRLVEHARAAVEAWAADLSEAERSAPSSQKAWGAAATLAHIAHWNQAVLTSLDLKAAGATVPWQWEDMDGQNARLLAQAGSRTWIEVADAAARVYAGLHDWIERLNEEDLRQADDFAWQSGGPLWQTFVGNAFFHPLVHLVEYYAATGRPDRAAALQAEIDEVNRVGASAAL
jgi:hypothetical protein